MTYMPAEDMLSTAIPGSGIFVPTSLPAATSMNPVTACPGTAVAVPTVSADRCALTAHAGLTIAQETVQTVLLIIVTFVGTWLRLYRVPWQVSGDPCLVAEVLEISAKRM
jgi:hypothetical protein